MIDPSLVAGPLGGRMSFRPGAAQSAPPLPPGRHGLAFGEGREAVLVVPEGLPSDAPVPLLVVRNTRRPPTWAGVNSSGELPRSKPASGSPRRSPASSAPGATAARR